MKVGAPNNIIVACHKLKMAAAQSNNTPTISASSSATNGAADMTRRMVCGGLAGMIAKVRQFK